MTQESSQQRLNLAESRRLSALAGAYDLSRQTMIHFLINTAYQQLFGKLDYPAKARMRKTTNTVLPELVPPQPKETQP